MQGGARARVLAGGKEVKESKRERERDEREARERKREKCISVVVNDERGVPAAAIAGKLCYYEQPAKK